VDDPNKIAALLGEDGAKEEAKSNAEIKE